MNQIVLILAISCLATVSLAHGPGGPRDPEKMKEWCAKEAGPEDEARFTCRITNQSDESKAAGETCATKMGATMPKSAKEAKAMMCDPSADKEKMKEGMKCMMDEMKAKNVDMKAEREKIHKACPKE